MNGAQVLKLPAVRPEERIKLAFFTLGDDRDASSHDLKLTIEEMWRRRAEHLAPGHAHGVQNLAEATDVLDALAPIVSIEEVFFLGHGSADGKGFFFFSGQRDEDPDIDFSAPDPNQVLEISRDDIKSALPASNPNKKFLLTLFKQLSRTVDLVKISFLACFMGKGETHDAICDFLRNWLLGATKVKFEVGAYTDFYLTVFNTDGDGQIADWTDRIVNSPVKPQTDIVANPGPDLIPPFQEQCAGVMIQTPFRFLVEPASMFQGDLDDEELSKELRSQFGLFFESLSEDNVTVIKESDGKWRIIDKDKSRVYRVIKKDDELHIFRP